MSFVKLFRCKQVRYRASWVIEDLVPVGDVVFPEGGEFVQDVMCGGVGLGVQEGTIAIDQGGVAVARSLDIWQPSQMSGDPVGSRLLVRRMAATLPMA